MNSSGDSITAETPSCFGIRLSSFWARQHSNIRFSQGMLIKSYAERNNLNCRTFLKRLNKLTLGFTKKVENLVAALWRYFAHYNFVRVHGSLRVTPAMAAAVTSHIWTIGEVLNSGI